MNEPDQGRVFRVVESSGPAGRLVFCRQERDALHRFVIAGYQGPGLPERLTDPVIEAVSGSAGAWRLRCAEGEFEWRALAVDRIVERPAIYAPLHRSFALSRTDRLAVRVLLWLLRLPGGPRWLRRWHARRKTHGSSGDQVR